ncbi:unnamed protein product [Rhizophagus irregularis]|nr:unnamed protein product [Rhizophagus irregularis]
MPLSKWSSGLNESGGGGSGGGGGGGGACSGGSCGSELQIKVMMKVVYTSMIFIPFSELGVLSGLHCTNAMKLPQQMRISVRKTITLVISFMHQSIYPIAATKLTNKGKD